MSAECAPAGVYRPRSPRTTPLYRLVEAHYDEVKGQWEERFEGRYGFWRGFVDEQVRRYLDCGLYENGFARVRCPDCRAENLLAFSCKTRELCPSCAAKRAAVTAALLREEVLEEVGHAQWVFVMPKMLRLYFLHHRELLFRHRVMSLLKDEGLLSTQRMRLLLSWRHTGFSVHNRVRVEPKDGAAVERLARYIMRPPISLERLEWDGAGEVRYLPKAGHDSGTQHRGDPAETIDAAELLARVSERCGGEMRIIAFIVDSAVVDKIIRHLRAREDRRERGPSGWADLEAAS